MTTPHTCPDGPRPIQSGARHWVATWLGFNADQRDTQIKDNPYMNISAKVTTANIVINLVGTHACITFRTSSIFEQSGQAPAPHNTITSSSLFAVFYALFVSLCLVFCGAWGVDVVWKSNLKQFKTFNLNDSSGTTWPLGNVGVLGLGKNSPFWDYLQSFKHADNMYEFLLGLSYHRKSEG